MMPGIAAWLLLALAVWLPPATCRAGGSFEQPPPEPQVERYRGLYESHIHRSGQEGYRWRDRFAVAGDPRYDLLLRNTRFDIPVTMDPAVAGWLDLFSGRGRRWFATWLERSSRFTGMIRAVLKKHGLPEDLVFVPLIESGYSTTAVSRARAVGTWQFIQGTGRHYDLRIDWYLDERRDPERSTEAAARYLAALHRRFGDWHLALAAYNGGDGRVARAIAATGMKDFWALARTGALPRETAAYVPKFIAAALIAKNPGRFGFDDLAFERPVALTRIDAGERPVGLEAIARCAGMEVEELAGLNPQLRHRITPPTPGGYRIIVPADRAGRTMEALAGLPDSERLAADRHVLAPGETLSHLARRYGVPAEAIMRANGILHPGRIRAGRELAIPVAGRVAARNVARPSKTDSRRGRGEAAGRHTVNPGDTLSGIARRYGIRIDELCRANRIGRRTLLRPGMRLSLPGGSGLQTAGQTLGDD